MATFAEDVFIDWCAGCKGPTREAIYRHQCDVRISATRDCPGYCLNCMIGRGICKRCGDSYGKFFNACSLRADTDTLKMYKGITPTPKKKFTVTTTITPIVLQQQAPPPLLIPTPAKPLVVTAAYKSTLNTIIQAFVTLK
jgi:hypothetical protein